MNLSEHGEWVNAGSGGGVGKVTGTFQDDRRQMYDCQSVGQRFDARPNSE